MWSRILEIFAGCVVLETWLMAALAAPTLPAQIPTKFGFDGSIRATGSPAMLWLLPLAATAVYAILTATQFMPDHWKNYPVKITERNRARVYALGHEMMPVLKVATTLTFLAIEWGTIVDAVRGSASPYFSATIYAPVALIIGTIIYFTVKMRGA